MFCALVVAAFSVGCAREEPEEPERHSPPMVLVEDDEVKGALVDSLWQELVPSVAGGPILNQPGEWVAEARWFRFDTRPESLYTFDEMEQLDAEGVIGDGTMVALVRYRFLLEAEDLEDASRKAEELTSAPGWPPQQVYDAMAEADREAEQETE
jgi:hypothetical protein